MKHRPLSEGQLTWGPDELARRAQIPVTVYPDKSLIYERFADDILEILRANNLAGRDTKLILPVGPRLHYPILVRRLNEENIPLARAHFFMMDEYLDWQGRLIDERHPLSFRGFLKGALAGLRPELRLPEGRLHAPDPCRIDDYSEEIARLGGIDACFGGVGSHGHVAFNEPPNRELVRVTEAEFLASKTRIVHLAPETVVLNCIRAAGGYYGDFPSMAVSCGMADILASGRIRLCCDGGEWQRYALRMALLGEPTLDYPVSLIQTHPDIRIYTDELTAQAVIPG